MMKTKYREYIRTSAAGILFFLSTASLCQAQSTRTPGNLPFKTQWLKNEKYEMDCYATDVSSETPFGTFSVDIVTNGSTVSVFTALSLSGQSDPWVDTCIMNSTTLVPIYRSSYNQTREFSFRYGTEVSGYYIDKQSNRKTIVKDPVREPYLDNDAYPYLLGLLPLSPGYRADIPVHLYRPEHTANTGKAAIEEVKNSIHVSKLTGSHKVWQVTVQEELSKDRYTFLIDQESRKIRKVDILSKGQRLSMVDRELDYHPFKQSFDKESTLKLITGGSAVISGQAFAKDNENEGLLSNVAIVNINKKQFPPQGTTIGLIPYTDFFKEWIRLNESSRKKGRAVPLPPDAAGCIKVATVYDDNGHFEFVNLMPGEYMVFTEFGYVHTSRRSETVGYADHYINGLYQGSSTLTESRSYQGNAQAAVKKVVKIERAGEKVEIKLKKTL